MQLSWQFNLSTSSDEPAPPDVASFGGKVCKTCGLIKPLDEFCIKTHLPGGRNTQCRICVRKVEDLRYWGITYEELLERFGTVCNICGGEENVLDSRSGRQHRLAVDHDHTHCSGCRECIRGLLCRTCNYRVGVLEANPNWVSKAIAYLGRDASWAGING